MPPDPSKVPASFWTESEAELQETIAAVLLLIWIASAEHHGWTDGMAAGETFATTHAAEVAAGFTATTRDRLATASATWGPDVTHGTLQGDLVSILGPDRAATLAVTETTVAQTMGGSAAVDATVGLSEYDLWITAQDNLVCPVCGPLHGADRAEWSDQFPLGPPAHANCRCVLEFAGITA